jgi:peptide/nickel transport system substrate-binding protein
VERVPGSGPSSINQSNILRNSFENLTFMGSDSITRPWILERWSASDDLKVWSLGARKDVKWSNGKPLESGDIVAHLKRWISKGSNLRHALRLQENNIEKFDQFTVRIYLDAPTIQIMETLAAGGAAVQNESFVSGGWEKFEFQPVTGQFQLQSYQPGIKAVLKRREGYRGPPAYLDGIEFFDFG